MFGIKLLAKFAKKNFQKSFYVLISFLLIFQSFAVYIPAVKAQEETLTPTPTETVITTPEVTETPTETPTPTETVTPEITTEPTVTPEVTIEPTSTPTETPVVEITENPTVTPEVTATVEPTMAPEDTQPVNEDQSSSDELNSDPQNEVVVLSNETPAETIPVLEELDNITNPIISTDKEDYAPTDAVIFTGSGYTPNTAYELVITSDVDALNFSTFVVSDNEGGIFFVYQLDGTFRPTYKVEVRDINSQSVAIKQFTDAPSGTVRICHATASPTNPYNAEYPNKSADLAGHGGHSGDIIPSFTYTVYEKVGSHLECPAGYSDYGDPIQCRRWANWHWNYVNKISVDDYADVEHTFTAKNFDLTGEAIWNNNCVVPSLSISGQKFNDVNGNALKDTGESVLSGVSITLDKDANGSIENTVVTGVDGNYSFTNLVAGTYRVREIVPTGYRQTTTNPSNIVLSTSNVTGVNFGNQLVGKITIIKNAEPNSSQDFRFSGTNGLGSFTLDDDNNGTNSNTKVFDNVTPGRYAISESSVTGWVQGDIQCSGRGSLSNLETHVGGVSFDLGAGAEVTCTFNNIQYGSISGYKWNDDNGNGVWDSGHPEHESGLRDWRIFIDTQDGIYNPGETYDFTDSNGSYRFSNLLPGTYQICEVENTDEGWRNTSGGVCRSVTVAAGQNVSNINFGNQRRGEIKVCKVIIDAAGRIVTNGEGLPESTFRINWSNGISQTVFSTVEYTPNEKIFTGSEGFDAVCVEYSNIRVDSYDYSQEIISGTGWETPRYNDQYSSRVMDLGDFYTYNSHNENSNGNINLELVGPTRTLVILNQFKVGSIAGVKWNDIDADGQKDENEAGLAGWTIQLRDGDGITTTTTATDGSYRFDRLQNKTYDICEVEQYGYKRISPADSNCRSVTVGAGQNVTNVDFYNQLIDPGLSLTKTNDAAGVLGIGSTVNYTLKVTNTGNQDLEGVTLTDALPGGFSYVANSTTVDSAPFGEPTVNGQSLQWKVNVLVGQTVTLVFTAKVGDTVTTGTQTNNAVAFVTYRYGVRESIEDSLEVARFVEINAYSEDLDSGVQSSSVEVNRAIELSTAVNGISLVLGASTEAVLGASTMLPATGSPTNLILIVVLLIAVGLLLKINIKGVSSKKTVKVVAKKTAKKVTRKVKKNAKNK